MSKLKIAHIAHSVGGVDVYIRNIIDNIDSEVFTNIVIHGQTDTNTPFLDNKNEPIRSYKTTITRDISLLSDIKAIFATYKILKKEQPNIIHAHSAKGGIIGRLAGRLLNIKVLFTPNAFSFLSEEKGIKKTIFILIEKFFANGNSVLLATSNSEKNRGINEAGYKENKTIVFDNCVAPIFEIKPLSIAKTWPDKYICTVGRPCFQKNIDFMVEVFHQIRKEKDIHLVVMGVGHHVGQLHIVEQLIKDLNLSNHVTILKWTSREDVLNIISKSQLYLSTARYEGMPYSVIESLALGKPCVVSDCDGNRDLIENGYNGFVIQDYDVIKYKNSVLEILNNDELKKRLSENAFTSFNEKYNILKNISQLEKIYKEQSLSQ